MVHYPVMGMDEIKRLPVPDLAADNTALFMWCTFPYINEQIKLFEHWGFKYRTIGFLWVKTNPRTNGTMWFTKRDLFFGVGYYAKSNPEPCLLGIKGRMRPVSNKVSNTILSPRRKHSRKPDEARERIVELFGDLPRIELFARQRVIGWSSWGNEVKNDVDLAGFNNDSANKQRR